MTSLKIFASTSDSFVPVEWAKAAEFPRHQSQGNVIVIAPVKQAVTALLTDRGLGEWAAESLARSLRLNRQPVTATDLKLVLDAGLIDLGTPGVYVWRQGVKDDPVVRVDPGGEFATVGHFRYDPKPGGRGLYVKPAARERR